MQELERLKELQKMAQYNGDFVTLNEINKKIFELRQEKRNEKAKQRQQEHDNKTAEKIEKILTL